MKKWTFFKIASITFDGAKVHIKKAVGIIPWAPIATTSLLRPAHQEWLSGLVWMKAGLTAFRKDLPYFPRGHKVAPAKFRRTIQKLPRIVKSYLFLHRMCIPCFVIADTSRRERLICMHFSTPYV